MGVPQGFREPIQGRDVRARDETVAVLRNRDGPLAGAALDPLVAVEENVEAEGRVAAYLEGEMPPVLRRHPLSGTIAAGRILGVPFSRGSSTTTAVLLEAVRAGTAPAAILTTCVDSFFALASVVANELYGRSIPLVVLEADDFAKLQTGDWIVVGEDGVVVRSHSCENEQSE